jgi:hypothetical protein
MRYDTLGGWLLRRCAFSAQLERQGLRIEELPVCRPFDSVISAGAVFTTILSRPHLQSDFRRPNYQPEAVEEKWRI